MLCPHQFDEVLRNNSKGKDAKERTMAHLKDRYTREALLYEMLTQNRVRCNLCAHHCVIAEGKRGACQVCENRELPDALTGGDLEIHTIGDAVEPRKVLDAIREGFEIGNGILSKTRHPRISPDSLTPTNCNSNTSAYGSPAELLSALLRSTFRMRSSMPCPR